ncbi:VOC family protein [Aeromicrobium alkaliterrae]|uniref:VOC family protein n=1 Tax=Aeromicrobium alkaliterrae TaxID=302168 RepID=A0ABN2JMY8_9ACTN
MAIRLNPYLNFATEAREALEFYQSALGGELSIMTFGDSGMSDDPSQADLVMHGQLDTPTGLTLMASDTPPGGDQPQHGTHVNVSLSSGDTDLQSSWDALTEGAEIVVPFELAPWGDKFGLFNDRFGIAWLVNQASLG